MLNYSKNMHRRRHSRNYIVIVSAAESRVTIHRDDLCSIRLHLVSALIADDN